MLSTRALVTHAFLPSTVAGQYYIAASVPHGGEYVTCILASYIGLSPRGTLQGQQIAPTIIAASPN